MLNNPLQPPHKDEHTKTKPPVSVGMCRCQLPAQKNHLKMKDYICTKKGATSEPYNDKSYWRSLSHLIPKATIVP